MFNEIILNKIVKMQFVNIFLILLLLSLLIGYSKYLDFFNINAIAYIGVTLLIMISSLVIIFIKLLYDSYKLKSLKLSIINSLLTDVYVIISTIFLLVYFQELGIGESLLYSSQFMLVPIIISIIIPFIPLLKS